jgi:hypothetical protein
MRHAMDDIGIGAIQILRACTLCSYELGLAYAARLWPEVGRRGVLVGHICWGVIVSVPISRCLSFARCLRSSRGIGGDMRR